MKKVCIALLFVSCFFALYFELRGLETVDWSFRSYFSYVVRNISAFPVLSFRGDFVSGIFSLLFYWFSVLFWLIDTILVLCSGLLPWNIALENGSNGLVDNGIAYNFFDTLRRFFGYLYSKGGAIWS